MRSREDDREDDGRVRLDKWLWAARFFKTRSLATEAVNGGKVELNGERAKPSKDVKVGDEIRVRLAPYEHVVNVRALGERRGSAAVAATLYEETEASKTARDKLREQLKSAPAFLYEEGGRPTKKDRRDLSRFVDRQRRRD
jgi:ribosome-associated heat shock protein Hsp15